MTALARLVLDVGRRPRCGKSHSADYSTVDRFDVQSQDEGAVFGGRVCLCVSRGGGLRGLEIWACEDVDRVQGLPVYKEIVLYVTMYS